MIAWFKQWVARYDEWCQSMGLTPQNKRSCVPYHTDPVQQASQSNKKAQR